MSRSSTILLVEDEPGVQDVALEMLRQGGFAVLVADEGEAALEVLASEPSVDLLLTDVMMPRLNGFELAHRARALRPTLPIVYISGYADEARLDAEAVHGPLLRKPFRSAELVGCVARMLKERVPGG